MALTHKELCERAASWLRSNRRCDPVLTKVGSAGEIPDAIGWSSMFRHRGSIVVECKTSRIDFLNDKKKYTQFKHPQKGWTISSRRFRRKLLQNEGYIEERLPSMGDYRFFLCEPEIVSAEDVKRRHGDHGLLHLIGKRVLVVLEAPERQKVNHWAEIRYLRFALIHVKDNLLRLGCSVDLTELTKFFGTTGVRFPADGTKKHN